MTYKTEALDRVYILQETLAAHIERHPFISENALLTLACEAAQDALSNLYQAIGAAPTPDFESAREPRNDAAHSQIAGSNSGQKTKIQPSYAEGIATDFLAVKPSVAVLFARADSIYKTMPECDVYDIDRDARNYAGPMPIVAHPPCRAWGVFAMFAKPREDEKALAVWSVDQVRKWGGVLEHPYGSKLWPELNLPEAGSVDNFGGWTLPIHQHWWGHRAEKKTKLYIVGIDPSAIPEIPLVLGEATHVIGDVGRAGKNKRPEISKAEREQTPPDLARWLVELAGRCTKTNIQGIA